MTNFMQITERLPHAQSKQTDKHLKHQQPMLSANLLNNISLASNSAKINNYCNYKLSLNDKYRE